MWSEPKQKQVDKRNNCGIKSFFINFDNSVQRTESGGHYLAEKLMKKTRRFKQRTQRIVLNDSRRKISHNSFQLWSVIEVTLPHISLKKS